MRSEPPLHSPLPPPGGARGGAGGQRVAGDAVEAPEASVRSTLSTPAGPSRGLGGHGSCRYSPTVSRLPAATWLPNPSCRGVALGIKRELDGAGSESGPDPRDQQAHLAATAPPVRCPGHSSATSTRPSTLRRQAAPRLPARHRHNVGPSPTRSPPRQTPSTPSSHGRAATPLRTADALHHSIRALRQTERRNNPCSGRPTSTSATDTGNRTTRGAGGRRPLGSRVPSTPTPVAAVRELRERTRRPWWWPQACGRQ